jgi:hypothetical protein
VAEALAEEGAVVKSGTDFFSDTEIIPNIALCKLSQRPT